MRVHIRIRIYFHGRTQKQKTAQPIAQNAEDMYHALVGVGRAMTIMSFHRIK